MVHGAPGHLQTHDASLDLTSRNRFLPMTLRAILRGVIRRRIRIDGFTAPRKTTDRGYRGLGLARNWVRDEIVVGPVGGPLGILWNGETRSGPSINVLIDVGLLLGWIRVRVARRHGVSYGGLLRNIGRRNRRDVIDVPVHVGGRLLKLLRLLRLGLALLLEGGSDCRKDGLKLCLERLRDISQQLARDLYVRRRLTGNVSVSGWLLRRRVGVSVSTTMSELPSRSTVLPAELEVLELGLLIALLTESRPDLRLRIRNRIRLVHRGGLLAACLPTIFMITEFRLLVTIVAEILALCNRSHGLVILKSE